MSRLIEPVRERNHVIAEMLDKGATRKFVAGIYGISLERVRQIWHSETRRKNMPLWRGSNFNTNLWQETLPTRVRNCLKRAGIETEDQLYRKIEKGGLCIRQFGEGCVEELNPYLSRKIALRKPIERDRLFTRFGREEIVHKSREIVFAE